MRRLHTSMTRWRRRKPSANHGGEIGDIPAPDLVRSHRPVHGGVPAPSGITRGVPSLIACSVHSAVIASAVPQAGHEPETLVLPVTLLPGHPSSSGAKCHPVSGMKCQPLVRKGHEANFSRGCELAAKVSVTVIKSQLAARPVYCPGTGSWRGVLRCTIVVVQHCRSNRAPDEVSERQVSCQRIRTAEALILSILGGTPGVDSAETSFGQPRIKR